MSNFNLAYITKIISQEVTQIVIGATFLAPIFPLCDMVISLAYTGVDSLMVVDRNTVLCIGGLDPSGGAGILGDVCALQSVGVHGAAVVAVSTLQDGNSFVSAASENPRHVRDAVERLLMNLGVGAVKTGALGSGQIVRMLGALAEKESFPPLIVDPVIRSTTGGVLLAEDGVAALTRELIPHVELITPNLQEAEILTGLKVADADGMGEAAKRLVHMGAGAALVKGGHLDGNELVDVFVDRTGLKRVFRSIRCSIENVRGTGCALASLTAGLMARGHKRLDAVIQARQLLREAIECSVAVGSGSRVLGFGGRQV
jgi:hydroxymethylpyrimidine/phosphomethylpyrimidine kinase